MLQTNKNSKIDGIIVEAMIRDQTSQRFWLSCFGAQVKKKNKIKQT